jgi:DHA1 family bicyclomycin/chloramphenicol resistance-like MFS transporter
MDAQTPETSAVARPHIPLWLLALVMLSSAAGMHILVPALPEAAHDLGAQRAHIMLAVTFYVSGMAVGQLVYGPIADYLGRRPTILVGLLLFAAASFGAYFAASADNLIALRLLQALGASSGMVLGRAIVRDVSGAQDAAKNLALLNTMVIVTPGLAPIIGGLLSETLGWRSIFLLLTLLGLAMSLLIWRMLPETGSRNNTDVGQLWRNYKTLLRDKQFIALVVGGGCATMSIYGFVAVAPFIFAELGRPPHETGFYLSVVVLGTWVASYIVSRLLNYVPLERVIRPANLVSLFAGVAFLVAVLTDNMSVPVPVIVMFIFSVGMGISSPGALSKAMSTNPAVIGSASGLYGFTQMSIGAVCTVLAGLPAHPALGAALVMTGTGLIAQLCFWYALRKN